VAFENSAQYSGFATRWMPLWIAAAVFALDRLTKVYIRAHLSSYDAIQVIPGWFRIVHTENPGAAFGMLADGSPFVRGVVLIGISALVLFFVLNALLDRQSSFNSTANRIGLALILGGAIGNLYDRVLAGKVTDFIEVYKGSWSFPAFNVADSAITVGAAFLLVDLVRPHKKRFRHQATHPGSDS
jgi:signal peptidase II